MLPALVVVGRFCEVVLGGGDDDHVLVEQGSRGWTLSRVSTADRRGNDKGG